MISSPPGDRTLVARLPLAITLILCVTTAVLPGATRSAAAVPSDIRFGAVEAYHAPVAAGQAGVAWQRVRFHWAEIQAGGEGSWDDGDFPDAVLARELAAGRQVVGLLIGLPAWANENSIPRGLYLSHTDPTNTWATFVRTVVGRYAGRIDHWILWNEPDVWDPNHPGHTWGGTLEDFVQLMRVGYVTAKETNPGAVIHLAAVTHWWDAAYGRQLYFQRFLDAVAADPNAAADNYFFDVATLHLYFQPHLIFDITSYYYGLMNAHGFWKPIWIVETNAAPSMDPAWPVANPRFHVSLEEQAAFMPQALALGMAAGAQRIAVYKMADTAGDVAANPEPFGLVRADGSCRPAFSTFQLATTMLAGATRVIRDQWDEVGQVTVEQPGGTTTVLFSRVPGPRVAQVPANGPTAILVDMWGNRQSVSAANGVFTIELPAAPCSQAAGDYCIIGGPTYYLVQGAPAPIPPTVPVVPATEAPLSSTPSGGPTAAPTGTPAAEPTAVPTATPTRTPKPTASPTAVPTATPIPSPTEPAATVTVPSSTPTTKPAPTASPPRLAFDRLRSPTPQSPLTAPAPSPAPEDAPSTPAVTRGVLITVAVALAGSFLALALRRLRR
jgi:hypothetical protein